MSCSKDSPVLWKKMNSVSRHLLQNSTSDLRRHLGAEARVAVWAPGRVCVLGGHVDFTRGCVLPAAIDVGITVAVAAAADEDVVVYSRQMGDAAHFTLTNSCRPAVKHWSNYVRGVVLELMAAGVEVPGLRMAIAGDIPIGTGLSSSAALEVAVAMAVLELTDHQMDPLSLARLCQRAENNFVGVKCGIMDPFASVHGREGSAIFLDCLSMEHRYLTLPPGSCIVIADTMKPRYLAESQFNARRQEVDEALIGLKKVMPHIEVLREVTPLDLVTHAERMSPEALKRARHVVAETARVCDAVRALAERDWDEFGRLMCESHESSRDLYESTIPELDLLWEIACSHDGCVGSRLTGAGFGGCTVSIVREEAVDDFRQKLVETYSSRTGMVPEVAVHLASDGASRKL